MSQKRVFLSYSHRDEAWMRRVLDFFAPVIRRETVSLWVDRDIQPGALWLEELRTALASAELAILLVSPHYLASDFIQREEIPPLLAAAAAGKTRLFLIPISDSAIAYTPLAPYQTAWNPAKPLETLPSKQVNSALREILDRFATLLQIAAHGAAPGPTPNPSPAPELLAEVFAPGPLPPCSLVPFSPNPHFVGRDAELLRLAELLEAGKLAALGQGRGAAFGQGHAAALGLGGIGKTQLAVEFAWRYGRNFSGGVFWLFCANPEAIAPQLAQIGAALKLHPQFEQLPSEQQLSLTRQALDGPEPRLLILDNCEDEEILARWRPRPGGCRVLLTSRKGSWSAQLGVAPLNLNALARSASVQLLQALCPRLDAADAEPLAELLGDLPLALELAGRYQQRYYDAVPPAQLRAELNAQILEHEAFVEGAELPGHLEQLPTHHQRALAATFAHSWDALDQSASDSAARRLLARAALLAPSEPIPRALLLSLLEAEPKTLADGLTRLLDLGLLSNEKAESVSIHRLIAAFASSRSQEAQPELVQELGEKLVEQADKISESGLPKPLIAWRAHLAELAEHAEKQKLGLFVSLANSLGYHWRQVAEWRQAESWYRRGLAIAESTLEAKDPVLAVLLNNLAQLLHATNRLAEAEPLMRRALAIDEASFGADHPNVAIQLNNLAQLLQDTNRLAEAEPLMRRALAIDEASFGADHPRMAVQLNNLAQLLQDTNRLAESEPLMRRALAIDEVSFGADHPMVAIRLNNLAQLLKATNRLAEAEPLMRRALAIDEASFGADHPNVAIRLNNLARLLQATNRLTEAEPLMRRALAIDEASFGADHPKVAVRLNNLATLLYATNRLAEAKPLMRRAFEIFYTSLGPEHPNTLGVGRNLSDLLKKT